MVDADKLKLKFKKQINESIDKYDEPDPKCAYAAGMLVVLSALKVKDGPTLSFQIALIHSALREVGNERGWSIE